MQNINNKNIELIEIYTDGASKGNPGISGIGFLIKKNEKILISEGFIIGIATNNFAEYFALIVAIVFLKKNLTLNKNTKLVIYADSLLLIKQLKKEYQIKNIVLKKCLDFLYDKLKDINVLFQHIPREKNKIADMLANKGINENKQLSEDIFLLISKFQQ